MLGRLFQLMRATESGIVKLHKSKAEMQFAASQKKSEQALEAKRKARQERADKTARLRALRLANDGSESEPEVGSEPTEASPQLPKGHRHQS